MEYYSLRSSLVRNILYDENAGNLDLFFVNGEIRCFSDVPKDVIRKLTQSKSPGRYYMRAIRDKYPRR
ncbi:KTSC domain-containing protein [Rhizobium rhizogenes]|uniref:KTSC domain-containing protein n=1 Tax=Rhizobium rhizogenes TaxID=359 RepID=UPI0015745266|nr:KTSC domain-containing protein [Rhizobium rhizogenes]